MKKNANIKKAKQPKKTVQYTIRGIPSSLNQLLREKARKSSVSLNEVTLEAIKKGIGENNIFYDDLDHLAGTWQEDNAFDEVLKEQNKIDLGLWD